MPSNDQDQTNPDRDHLDDGTVDFNHLQVPAASTDMPQTIEDQIRTAAYEDSVKSDSLTRKTLVRLGEYTLQGEIARGGMGVVYKAHHDRLNRTVAIKMILRGNLASESEVKRFFFEAEAAARLEHSGIVPIFEIGEIEGNHFFSMAYIEGESLQNRLKLGPLPVKEAATLIKCIAEATHYAHTKGIIHRDLKPHNILLDRDGTPKVSDFGLAKQLDSNDGLTQSGDVLGTPSYMSPEQAQGNASKITPLTDVYSVGAILYAMLTGRPPFQAASLPETLRQVIDREPVSPSLLNPDTPRDLETICLKCLQKDPSKRYSSLAAMAEDLDRFLRNEPVRARPVGVSERSWRWIRRHPIEAALIGTAFIAVLMTSIGLVSLAYQDRLSKSLEVAEFERKEAEAQKAIAIRETANSERDRKLADTQRIDAEQKGKEANEQRERAELEEQRVRKYFYLSQVRVAKQHWMDSNLSAMQETLKSCIPANGAEDLRGFEWFYLQRLTRGYDYDRLPGMPQVTGLAFDRQGVRVAACGAEGLIRVWTAETDREIWQRKTQGTPSSLLWAYHDDALLVGFNEGSISSFDAAGNLDRESDVLGGIVGRMAVSGDGKMIAAALSSNKVAVLDSHSLKLIHQWNVPQLFNQVVGGLCFSHDGNEILTSKAFGTQIERWNVLDGSPGTPFPLIFDSAAHLQRDPSGSLIVAASSSPVVVLMWESKSEKLKGQLQGNRRRIEDIAVSVDGKVVASAGNDTTVRVWYPDRESPDRILRGHPTVVKRVALSSTSQHIVSCDVGSNLFSWKGVKDSLAIVKRDHSGYVLRVACSRDGKFLASGAQDKSICLYNASDGSFIRKLNGHENSVEGLEFSPDSKTLYSSSNDATIRVWNLGDDSTSSAVAIWKGHSSWIWRIALTPDGKWLASASHDGTLRLWETANGNCKFVWKGHSGSVMDVIWDQFHQQFISAGQDGTIRGWNIDSENSVWSHATAATTTIDVSPDGRWLAISGAIIDYQTKEVVHKLTGNFGTVHKTRFSPDGKRVLACGVDANIRVWVCDLAQEILRLDHESTVFDFTFNNDGSQLISASRDGTMRIWDARTK